MKSQDIIYEEVITLPGSEQDETEFHPGQPGSCNHHLTYFSTKKTFFFTKMTSNEST